MTQQTMFALDDPPRPEAKARRSDGPESHAAAQSIIDALKATGQDPNKPSKELFRVFLNAMRICEPCTARGLEAYIGSVPNEYKLKFSEERIRAAKAWCAASGYIEQVATSKAGGVWQRTTKGKAL